MSGSHAARVLTATALAAALGASPPSSGDNPRGGRNLGDVNASAHPGAQGEVSIAVDRLVPSRVVAAAMNVDDGRLLAMASDDGGDAWSRALLPLPQRALLHADPMLAFDSRGQAHLAVIPVAADNQALGIELLRSSDGGRTWSAPLRISKATGRDDKVALAVDDTPESPFRDRIHVAWKWPSGGMFHAFSSDGGASFSRPRLVDTAAVSGLDLAVARDGRVFLAASDGEARVIRVLSSWDGGRTFSASVPVAPVRAQWYTSQPSHCRRQSLVHASIAVDRSSGPRRGMLYLTWADYAPGVNAANCGDACNPATACITQAFVTRSTDAGRTWTAPLALPDQQPGSDRYLQWARVDASDGALYVAYKDSRLDPRRVGVDVYLSRSIDGALTWEPPLRLSSATSDASAFSFQYGDYQGLAVAEGRLYAAWSDYRTRDGEVFVGRALFAPSP